MMNLKEEFYVLIGIILGVGEKGVFFDGLKSVI